MSKSTANTQAKFLKHIALALIGSKTLGEVLVAALNTICRYTGWPIGHAFVVAFDEGEQAQRLVSSGVWYGSAGPAFDAFRTRSADASFRHGEGLPGDVWKSRAATSTTDVRDDPRFSGIDAADKIRGCFAIPLVAEDRVVAVFEFFSEEPILVDGYFLDAIETAGTLLGHAIEREAAAERLRESEQKRDFLTAAIEHASDGIAIYRPVDNAAHPYRVWYVNDAFERQTGYSREETIGQAPSMLFGPDTDAETVRRSAVKLFAGHPLSIELFKYRKDGTPFWAEVNVRPVGGAGGKPDYLVSIQRDITERKRAEEELTLLSAAVQNASEMLIITDAASSGSPAPGIRYTNDAWTRTTGYTREESMGKTIAMLFGPETDSAVIDALRDATTRGVPFSSTARCYRKDGTQFLVEFSTKPILDRDGSAIHWVGTGRDVTERAATQAKLELLSSAVDRANDIIAMFERGTDDEWRMSYVNDAFSRVTGYSAQEAVGQTTQILQGPQTDRNLLNLLRERLRSGHPCRAEIAFYRKDGSTVWVELNARPLVARDGVIRHTIVLYRDITESRLRREVLSHEAAHDPLTGLYNRRFLDRALEESLRTVEDSDIGHCLLYLDLDGFKRVNDEYGHEAGDRLLAELSRCLCGHLREADIIARVGGDEFAVLLQRCSPGQAEHVAQQLIEAVRGYRLNWEGTNVAVGVSIGVAAIDASIASAKAALRRADEACYAAKKGGRNRIALPQIPAYHS